MFILDLTILLIFYFQLFILGKTYFSVSKTFWAQKSEDEKKKDFKNIEAKLFIKLLSAKSWWSSLLYRT